MLDRLPADSFSNIAFRIAIRGSKSNKTSNSVPDNVKNTTDTAAASGGDNSTLDTLTRKLLLRPASLEANPLVTVSTSTKRSFEEDAASRIVIEVGSAPPVHNNPVSEEALLNRSSVLFVAVSFILLMVISLAWLVFYYVQRFRHLHSKERVSRRLAELAKKAVARIPTKTLHPGDREITSDLEQCAICIEPFRPMENIRILPCRHYFHKICIDPWLLEQRSCPMCKLDILQVYDMPIEVGAHGLDNLSATGRVSGHSNNPFSTNSDEGVERIALVHSLGSVRTSNTLTQAAVVSTPPLAYVVLSNASTATSYTTATPSTAICYYMPNSTEHDCHSLPEVQVASVFSPLPTVTSTSSGGTAIPLTNPVIVSVLHPTTTTLVWDTVCPTPTTSAPDVKQLSGICPTYRTETVENITEMDACTSSSSPTPRVSTSGKSSLVDEALGSSVERVAAQDVTHTTQAFNSPVCSVVAECETHTVSIVSTTDTTRLNPDSEPCSGDSLAFIHPVCDPDSIDPQLVSADPTASGPLHSTPVVSRSSRFVGKLIRPGIRMATLVTSRLTGSLSSLPNGRHRRHRRGGSSQQQQIRRRCHPHSQTPVPTSNRTPTISTGTDDGPRASDPLMDHHQLFPSVAMINGDGTAERRVAVVAVVETNHSTLIAGQDEARTSSASSSASSQCMLPNAGNADS